MIKVFGTVEEAIASKDRRAYLLGDAGPMKLMKYGGEQYPVEFSTIAKADRVSAAPTINEGIKVSRIAYPSKELVEKAMAIFRAAYERFGTEMCVILKWIPEETGHPARYAIDRPEYALVSSAHVRHVYRNPRMGIMHSHPSFSGVPSGTDDANEEGVPGVYMVIGDIKSSKPSITFSVCGDGFRQKEEYPYKEFNPPVLTKEEADWWLENVMTQSEADGKKDGWYIKDQQSHVIYWFATEEEAKTVAGEEYETVKVQSYTAYVPGGQTKSYGYGVDWESEYEAVYREYNAAWKRGVEPTNPAPPQSSHEPRHDHLINFSGKRRKKRHGPQISFSFQRGEWVEAGLRLRNMLGIEDIEIKKQFLNALLYGQRPKPVVSSSNSKFNVTSCGPSFVQPQKPQIILLPSRMPPREIRHEGAVYYPEVGAHGEIDPGPEFVPVETPAPSSDDTAVMDRAEIEEAVAEAEKNEDPVEAARRDVLHAQKAWFDKLKEVGVSPDKDGSWLVGLFELGRLTEKETNDLLELEGNLFLAQNALAEAEKKAGLSEEEKDEECLIMSELLRTRGVITAGDGAAQRMEALDQEHKRFALGPGQGDWIVGEQPCE